MGLAKVDKNMARGKRLSATERLARLERERKRLEAAAAVELAVSRPVLKPLVDAIEGMKKKVAEANKGFGDGPQSFAVREAKHQNWIAQIRAEQLVASAVLANAENVAPALEKALSVLATDPNASASDVRDAIDSAFASGTENIAELADVLANVTAERKNYSAANSPAKGKDDGALRLEENGDG